MERFAGKEKKIRAELQKQCLNQNLKAVTQVWHAFAKFLATQVNGKERAVNTNLIGIFAPNNAFWPSPDFLAASRLRLKDESFSPDTYSELYNNQLSTDAEENARDAQRAVTLNFASIAMVCGSTVKTETAYKILKGAFAYVVDNPNDQALRLKLKGFGVLQINDRGHGLIRFRSLKEDEEDRSAALEVRINGRLGKTKKAPTERQEMDDLRNFIDAASYRLSAGGADGTISIKSGFLSNMSVRTPRSKLSLQSVTSL